MKRKEEILSSQINDRACHLLGRPIARRSCSVPGMGCKSRVFLQFFFESVANYRRVASRYTHSFPFPVLSSTSVRVVVTKKLSVCTSVAGMVVRRHMVH